MARQPESATERVRGRWRASRPGWPPPSHEHTLELRREAGWTSPLEPVAPGAPYCLFSSADICEWLFHPYDAERLLARSIFLDGIPCTVEQVGEYPLMGAVQLRATKLDRAVGYVADRQAA